MLVIGTLCAEVYWNNGMPAVCNETTVSIEGKGSLPGTYYVYRYLHTFWCDSKSINWWLLLDVTPI